MLVHVGAQKCRLKPQASKLETITVRFFLIYLNIPKCKNYQVAIRKFS